MPCVNSMAICNSSPVCPAPTVNLQVFPQIATNSTWLTWDLSKVIAEYGFQLPIDVQIEYAHAGVIDSLAWQIADPYESRSDYQDAAQRVFGSDMNLYYRLALMDAEGTVYRTSPVRAGDFIPNRVRRYYNEVLRRWNLRARKGELREGYLLKRIRWGTQCPDCRDRDSGAQLKSFCLTCYDTGFEHGFYQPVECFYGFMGTISLNERRDDQRGFTQDGPNSTLQFLNIPTVYPGDVWVEKASDLRFVFGEISSAQRLGTVQLITTSKIGQIPFTDVIYRFNVRD